jgi:glycosyltransferase involved in cell wall biosynthesis
MKILINASNLRQGGGLQVGHSFLNEIKYNSQHQFIVVLSTDLSHRIQTDHFPENFEFFVYSIKPSILNVFFGRDIFLDSLVAKKCPDRIFTVFGPHYWNPKVAHIVGFAKPQYIFKDSPFFDQLSRFERFKMKMMEVLHMHSFKYFSDVLITENEVVSSILQSLIPGKKVYTVSNCYNQIFDNSSSWVKKMIPRFDGITLLTISANYPHKNLNIIPEVIRFLSSDFPTVKVRFVLSLNSDEMPNLPVEAKEFVHFTGLVSIEECPSLYSQADFLFLPTLLECFSASYPEAMKMERPILTSDLPFARNLCGDAAEYFDPVDPADVAKKIVGLIYDKAKQRMLVENGKNQLLGFYNASQRTEKYIKIIEETN